MSIVITLFRKSTDFMRVSEAQNLKMEKLKKDK